MTIENYEDMVIAGPGVPYVIGAVVAVGMVRDEADIVEHSVWRMLGEVDHVVVADNGSTDGTREILERLATEASGRLTVLADDEEGYYQSRKITHLARIAARLGAAWVVPFDADEFWYSPFYSSVAAALRAVAPQWLAVSAQMFDHVATAVDEPARSPFQRIGWRRRAPGVLPKVAVRASDEVVVHQGNHAATFPGGTTVLEGQLIIRHYPYRSGEQMVRKARNGAAAYAAAVDLPAADGAHWRQYGALLDQIGEARFVDEVFRPWFWSEDPAADETLIYDPAPGA